ncbi:MAG: hypothetical protein A2117_00670 [Candidatus Wildermuthbacteria bacterium GWA2_46_15]|uniref:PIN domain-containing protein n=1 Tax=Candidatus Wildermuthbacteria bacterium GWA2_46_15 TaxID=1802443 RepID=A0A1G2QNB8_9BACT|nr:MAG: hypothetical protein A2117_00670 [Candidatus Wildermuthbacteria bacterium GWA2_46_15]
MSPLVFFNASVILAGLKSSTGASRKLLEWAAQGKIRAVVSEVVLDEVWRNLRKLDISEALLKKIVISFRIEKAPAGKELKRFKKLLVDPDDVHILTSAKRADADFLVTLDKKHILVLQRKIQWTKIVSPGELFKTLLR